MGMLLEFCTSIVFPVRDTNGGGANIEMATLVITSMWCILKKSFT